MHDIIIRLRPYDSNPAGEKHTLNQLILWSYFKGVLDTFLQVRLYQVKASKTSKLFYTDLSLRRIN